MPEPRTNASRRRAIAVTIAFGAYAVGLLALARWVGHGVFQGWTARVAAMGVIALGLLPWGRWLKPRVAQGLGAAGRCALVGAYFTLLVPFAILARCVRDPLRRRRSSRGTQWVARSPLPNTLTAAGFEH